jgi:hypothetical protein
VRERFPVGTYDRDGSADVLFWYSGYNDDGFTLSYGGLTKHSDFRWNYHSARRHDHGDERAIPCGTGMHPERGGTRFRVDRLESP